MNIKKIINILLFGIIIGFTLFLFSKNYKIKEKLDYLKLSNKDNKISFYVDYPNYFIHNIKS
jgi:hypothetical protein